jgi:hypothetical protein
MAGKRKNLRDAVTHEAGADNGNTCFGHSQPAV